MDEEIITLAEKYCTTCTVRPLKLPSEKIIQSNYEANNNRFWPTENAIGFFQTGNITFLDSRPR